MRVWRDAFAGFLEVDHSALLGRIRSPTLVTWGACDAIFTRADQIALRDGIAGATLVTYAGGGHGFHW